MEGWYTTSVVEERVRSLKLAVMVVVGFVVGALTGLTGVGPGFLTAAALAYLFGFAALRAHAESLIVMLAASAAALVIYGNGGFINWPFAIAASVGALVGAIFGARMVRSANSPIIRRVVAVVIILAGVEMILTAGSVGDVTASLPIAGLVAGLASGLIGGAAGIAGGTILIPILALGFAVPQKLSQSVALVVVLVGSLPGVLIYYAKGEFDRRTGRTLAIGGAIGGAVGAVIAVDLAPTLLVVVFGVFLVLLASAIFAKG